MARKQDRPHLSFRCAVTGLDILKWREIAYSGYIDKLLWDLVTVEALDDVDRPATLDNISSHTWVLRQEFAPAD